MPAESRENPLLKKGNSDAFFKEKYLTKNSPVVTHTAAYCQILFFKVDVLPSQTTDLSNTQACIIGYLYRKKCRIVFLFQKVL